MTYVEYTLIYSGKEKHLRTTEGVGLLIHNKYKSNIIDIRYVNQPILNITV